MNQSEINEREWQTPDNWSGPDWLCLYFSKKDSRTLVPKRIPWMGFTLNLGQPSGVYALVGIILAVAAFSIVPVILVQMLS